MSISIGADLARTAGIVIDHEETQLSLAVPHLCRPPVPVARHTGAVRDAQSVVSQRHRVQARGAPPDGGLRVVPRERAVQRDAKDLLRLPLGSPQGRPLPDTARVPVRDVPSLDIVDGRALGSRRADRRAAQRGSPHAGVRVLPPRRELPCVGERLHLVPPEGLRRDDHPEPCRRGVSDQLRVLSSAVGHDVAQLGRRRLQSQRVVPVARDARDGRLRDLPQEQRLPWHGARLRRLPHRQVHRHEGAEPCRGRVPDGL